VEVVLWWQKVRAGTNSSMGESIGFSTSTGNVR